MINKTKGFISYGLDIGSTSVKGVKLLSGPDGYELLGASVSPIKNPNSREEVLNSIKSVSKDINIEDKMVNISVLGNNVVVRYITLPKMSKDELKNAIKFEAEKYVPFNMDDVVLDYQIFDENFEPNKMFVLLVVAKKDIIDYRIKLLDDVDLNPRIIDVDSFALANAFIKNSYVSDKNKSVALVHIGAKFTEINVIYNDLTYFTRTVELGGEDITKQIANFSGINHNEANSVKIHLTQAKELEVYDILKNLLNTLIDEIKLSLGYYENQFGRDIDYVYISGGATNFKGLIDFLKKNLNLELLQWDPLKFLKISDLLNKSHLDLIKNDLGVSIGLGIRE